MYPKDIRNERGIEDVALALTRMSVLCSDQNPTDIETGYADVTHRSVSSHSTVVRRVRLFLYAVAVVAYRPVAK
jgi:hypothetical protein